MKAMHRIALFAIMGTMAFAQTDSTPAEKPPDGLEQAVLARANELYALLVKQQYRQAEAYIAEDTKDYYYAGAKPEIRKYEVQRVEFSDHFTRAKVFTRCTEPVVVAGFPPGDMNVTIPTLWKLENGNWYLYEDPNKVRNPGGVATQLPPLPARAGAPATPTMPAMPAMPKDLPKDAGFVLGKVQVDKREVKISAGGTEKVTIANGSAGTISLECGYPLGGIQAKLDRTEVNRGEKAVLTLTAGKEPAGGAYYVRIMPTGEALVINVVVQ
jgi:hypothetical protein